MNTFLVMDKLKRFLERFKKLQIDSIMKNILDRREIQMLILEYNKQQLREGKDIEGRSLSSINPYEESYADLQNSTTVDLNVTGKFYDTFDVRVYDNGFEIIADTDLYGVDFRKVYGNILGLDDRNLNKLEDILKPHVIEEIRKYLKDDI